MSQYSINNFTSIIVRIAVSNLHKETEKKFSDVISILYHMKNPITGKAVPMIAEKYYDIVMKHKDELDAAIAAGKAPQTALKPIDERPFESCAAS